MRFCRFVVFAAGLAAVISGLMSPLAHAQDAQRPVGIISIAPLDRFLKDTSYLLRAANVPEIGGLVSIMANQYTQGLDRSRPLGVSISLDGPLPTATVFLPISERSQFFNALAGMGIEPEDLGDGLFEIDAAGQTLFAKHTGNWMFVAQSENALSRLPADPSAALGELPKNYDLAFRINVQALPPELKEWATEQMRTGFERSLAEQRGQTAAERDAARQVGEAQIVQIERLITETDQVMVGWNADSDGQRVYIDVAAQFVAGSKLAEQVAAMRDLNSDYTNFSMPGAAARFRFTSQIPEEERQAQIQNLRNSLSQLDQQQAQLEIPPELVATVKEFVQGMAGVLEKTIAEGTFDGGGSLSLTDNTPRVLLGGYVADGRDLEREVKRIAQGISGKPNAPRFEFDYETYQGVTLHRMTAPIASDDPEVIRIFGNSLNIVIGTSEKSFMLALDPVGDTVIKAAIDRMAIGQPQQASPFDAVIEVSQLLRFAQAISPNSMIENALQTTQQYAGKDKVEITGRMIERGGMYRISVEEGVLRAAGSAAKAGSPNGGF